VSTDQIVLNGLVASDLTHLSIVKEFTFGVEERYGIGFPRDYIEACKVITAKIREFITSGSWDQFFGEHFPNVDHGPYKPDPYNLDSCV
jgi:glutamate transport system substrate-binding protein